MNSMNDEKSQFHATAKEKRLIRLIRETSSGELRIIVKNKQPVKVDKTIRKLEL